jgi:glucose/arabinose dehydrogenase
MTARVEPFQARPIKGIGLAAALVPLVAASLLMPQGALGQTRPTLVDRNLIVEPVVSGLELPTAIAFLRPDDILVLEKNTGKVKRVAGAEVSTVLDLSVNNFSERGLLGMALHPDFPANPGVYLFWTCRSVAPQDGDPFRPEEQRCSDSAMTGLPDSGDVLQVPLLGNRVDRFEWTGNALVYDHNLETLLAFQSDGAPEPPNQGDDATGPHGPQPARGNHDGGVLAFGPDGKLYVMFGDAGRRGALQNLPCGPTATRCDDPEDDATPDDQFGGPDPDDAHFSGVILRLNEDGTTPTDNPFFAEGARIGGEVGANIQRIYAYGIRNSFGMAVDPLSGNLWQQENGEDAFDELNRVEAGMNSGWIQIAGPSSRIGQYREIETTSLHHDDFPNLQQFRWGPERIATTREEALSRLFSLPGSHYSEPEFSWKHVLAPSAIGFQVGGALGRQYRGDLFVGFSTTDTLGGPLFRFNLVGNRRMIGVDDARLEDRVADNRTFHDMTESESLLFGTDFGIVTDVETGPNGNLFVVSLDHGAIYEISHR